ncbi:hypothetical protein BC629DRAFT_1139954 [Irpex lacteus]|nr:hypothetical protein BC629DRAFT_1139954 [Irpex lacteus]
MTLGGFRGAELFSCRRRRRRCFSLACVAPSITQQRHVATLGRAFSVSSLSRHHISFNAPSSSVQTDTHTHPLVARKHRTQSAVGAQWGLGTIVISDPEPRTCHSPQNGQRQIMRFGASAISQRDEEGRSPGMVPNLVSPRFTARFQHFTLAITS